MRHHQKADRVESELARERDVLLGDVGLGAVRGDADRGDAEIFGEMQMLDRADPGQQQRGYFGAFDRADHGAKIFFVGVQRKTVVHRRAAEPIAVRHFDERHARRVESRGDAAHLLERDLMTLRVHAVAQAHVVQHDLAMGLAHRAPPVR